MNLSVSNFRRDHQAQTGKEKIVIAYRKMFLIVIATIIGLFGFTNSNAQDSEAPSGFCTMAPPDNPGWQVSGVISLPVGCPENGRYAMSKTDSVTRYSSWSALNDARGSASATIYFEGGASSSPAPSSPAQPTVPSQPAAPAGDRVARIAELDAIYRSSGWEQWLRAAGITWSGNAPEARQPEEATFQYNGETRVFVIGLQVRGNGINFPYPTCLTTDRPGEVQKTAQTVQHQPDMRNPSVIYTNATLNGQGTLYVNCTDWGQLASAASSSQQFSEQQPFVPQGANPQGTIPQGDGAQQFAGNPEQPGSVPPPTYNDGRNAFTFENIVGWFGQESFLFGLTNGQLLLVIAIIALIVWAWWNRGNTSGGHDTAHAGTATNPTNDAHHAVAHNTGTRRWNPFARGGHAHALNIKSDTLPAAEVDKPYTTHIEVEHPSGAVIYAIGNQPSGMTIDGSGTIYWPSPTIGTHIFRVKATDNDESKEKNLTLTVNAPAVQPLTAEQVLELIRSNQPAPAPAPTIDYRRLVTELRRQEEANPTPGRRGGKPANTSR